MRHPDAAGTLPGARLLLMGLLAASLAVPAAGRAQGRAPAPADTVARAAAARADSATAAPGPSRAGTVPGARGAGTGTAGSGTPGPASQPDSGTVITPQVAPEDTSRRGLQIRRARSAVADTAAPRLHQGRFDAPRWVMLRSLAFPGWGQIHNGAWLKAGLLGGAETALLVSLFEDNRRLDEMRAEADALRGNPDAQAAAIGAYNDRLNRFVSHQWLLGGVLVYALMDAYVDAHFRDFKVEFERDPALPGGVPPAGTRLSLRWTF